MNNSVDKHETSESDETLYLTFKLDDESFATQIGTVREVLEYTQVTPVPRSPEFMQGVINLRGNVVPVVDLRIQFAMNTSEPTVDSCIIIIETSIDGVSSVIGILADSVQEVLGLRSEQLEPAPTLGTRVNNKFIQHIGKLEDRFVIILDMDKVFSIEQLSQTEEACVHRNKQDDTAMV